MKKDIFLVDADDTVLDFHGASELSLKNAFLQCGIAWKEEYLNEFRTLNAGLWEALERKELTRDKLMECRFPLLMERLGLHEVDGHTFNRIFLQSLADNPIYMDGAQRFLQTLGSMGRVYIVTNGTAWIQKRRFEIANLYSYACDVFVSDLIGFNKPAKEYTDYVISHIENFDKERAVWIGDSLSADIKAANEANITSIWYNPEKKELTGTVSPTYTVDSFGEAIKILQNA